MNSPFRNADPQKAKSGRVSIELPIPFEQLAGVLVFTLQTNGKLLIAGPIKDPGICKKMIEEGWAQIVKLNSEPEKPALWVPPGMRSA